ncbi:MAG: hypothetical protein HY737_07005 [Candidatus Omnitrophica bacterium]|nr:hypothetical protein [Candidatus Omnitrophota bacterium]
MAKITFDLRDGQIVIEGAEKELIEILQVAKTVAPHFKDVNIHGEVASTEEARGITSPSGRKTTVREFAKELPVSTFYERIAAIAYHAIKHERRASFSPKEMEDWFGLCGFKKPSNMRVAFNDAKRKYGYIERKGHGQWTISTGGENIILEMLERKGGNP